MESDYPKYIVAETKNTTGTRRLRIKRNMRSSVRARARRRGHEVEGSRFEDVAHAAHASRRPCTKTYKTKESSSWNGVGD